MLTISSLLFYAWGEPWFVLVMIGSIIGNWALARWISARPEQKRFAIISTLFMNLGIMFIFKYLTFVLENINGVVGGGIKIPLIDLPIGISFFTFQAMSYVFDVSRGHGSAQRNPLNVALYVSFFPQLIAGPIVRYETIANQIQYRRETLDDFSAGACRFIVGLAKKMLLANTLAVVADAAFSAQTRSPSFAWLGLLAYTFQIFYDFSGYSDMAIGLGRMFGFHFLENFDYPYISRSITEFWRRWHISLGTWFRDYLYFPLGGSRVKNKVRLVFNLFVVWLLTGVWHGANWTFILWGLMYFILISLEKSTGLDKFFAKNFLASTLGHVYTHFFVMMGWMLFRSPSVSGAAQYAMDLFGGGAGDATVTGFWWHENIVFFIAAAIFSTPVAKWVSSKTTHSKPLRIIYPIIMLLLFLVTVSFVVKSAYNPFIYFNF